MNIEVQHMLECFANKLLQVVSLKHKKTRCHIKMIKATRNMTKAQVIKMAGVILT